MGLRVDTDKFSDITSCPRCQRPPYTKPTDLGWVFSCCGSPVLTRENWNLYTQGRLGEVEPTPEEDEAFEELERKLNPEPEWPLASMGRSIERFGKLLQDRNSTVVDLVEAARSAGFNLRVGIQPEVEETTDERQPEHQ